MSNPTEPLTLEEFLIRDNAAMRRAGCELAEAALNVIREYDGTHRLALAAAAWMQTIANEGGRGETHGGVPVVARDDAAELRAAIREWCAAVEAERSAWDSAYAAYTDKTLWDKHQEANRLVIAAEVRLHTLAATERSE